MLNVLSLPWGSCLYFRLPYAKLHCQKENRSEERSIFMTLKCLVKIHFYISCFTQNSLHRVYLWPDHWLHEESYRGGSTERIGPVNWKSILNILFMFCDALNTPCQSTELHVVLFIFHDFTLSTSDQPVENFDRTMPLPSLSSSMIMERVLRLFLLPLRVTCNLSKTQCLTRLASDNLNIFFTILTSIPAREKLGQTKWKDDTESLLKVIQRPETGASFCPNWFKYHLCKKSFF